MSRLSSPPGAALGSAAPGVLAVEIARELGVSHTTLFNRFGSKEALDDRSTRAAGEGAMGSGAGGGSYDRPIRKQLVEHGTVIWPIFKSCNRD